MSKYVTEERFNAREKEVDQRFDGIDRRFDAVDLRLNQIDGQLGNIMTILDGMSVILQRLDHERLFTFERVNRLETDVNRIKTQLNIA